jgi:hypothetical protein
MIPRCRCLTIPAPIIREAMRIADIYGDLITIYAGSETAGDGHGAYASTLRGQWFVRRSEAPYGPTVVAAKVIQDRAEAVIVLKRGFLRGDL